MSNKKIVTRIRKLMALAESSNENEAASAAKLARKLMIEHAVSMSSLSEDAMLEEDPVEDTGIEVGKSTWAINLAWAIGSHCKVSVIRSVRYADRNPYKDPPDAPNRSPYDWTKHRRRTFAVAYGHRSDLEVWEYLFQVAHREIQRLAKEYRAYRTERYGYCSRTKVTSYREGLVAGLSARLRDMAREDEQPSEETALALSNRAGRAQQARDKAHPKLGSYSGGVGGSMKGWADAKKINIHTGLRGGKDAKQLR